MRTKPVPTSSPLSPSPPARPVGQHPAAPAQDPALAPARAEAAEVAGRHKNDGQKDHKGAR